MYRVISSFDSRRIVIYYTLSRVNEQLLYRSTHSDLSPLDILTNDEALSRHADRQKCVDLVTLTFDILTSRLIRQLHVTLRYFARDFGLCRAFHFLS